MLIRALLKKKLFLLFYSLQIILIFAILAVSVGCKPTYDTYSTPAPADKQPPTTPGNLIVEAISPAKINVDWNASTDNQHVKGYKIFRDGLHIRSSSGTSTSDLGLNPDTKYCYTVSAYDDSQNESPQSQSSCATTPPDLTPPTSPTKLIANTVSSDQIDLWWDESTDDGIVSGYKIFRNGSHIKNVTETRFSDTGLNPETRYCYTVSAYDAGGNESDSSNQACTVSSWIITTIDHLYSLQQPSVAIDSSNYAHVVYAEWIYTGPNSWISNLKYATNTTESWVIETIADRGNDTFMALDSADRVHVSFSLSGNLYYVTNISGVWLTEKIDLAEYVYDNSIAIDTTDNAHIIYDTGYDLRYITNASGAWIEEILDNSGGIGSTNSIAVDLFDNVHISAIGGSNGDIINITNASGAWVTESVSTQEDAGSYPSIAVDSAGNINISYYDRTNADLKYATNASGIWVTETVDNQGDVGKYPSIAVDSAGNAHISYYDSSTESLNYATNASGEWERYILYNLSELVQGQGNTWQYGFSSIALDSADRVHIVNNCVNDVRYITNR
jgi:chitodextrinase